MMHQRGFTLLELLFVASIVGILAVVAMPAYLDYVNRSKISEVLQVVKPVMEHVKDYYGHTGRLPRDNAVLALPAADILKSRYVSAIKVDKGILKVTLSNNFSPEVRGLILQLVPKVETQNPLGFMTWQCQAGQVPSSVLPSACRGE